ncbi:glycosyltransferase family 2 protein [Aggregicoccus sp. 17bor-14]|uniref:glycosyltransferase family 2 protein n=1 Tax=Myxococcaceae TaxID=31 RepID=UPI00129C281B|nr:MULTISPECIES: glycosyltransferase family 2 protein [Myxococcaceae]MBF5043521.1 glycosyltransferase family 2 protein [Simulacricoccus sp. 17bor-14]MRI89278.1 glycosyltransferase family 2 protein [Aggregicoccus sp. 17bor-14]
MPVPSAPPVTLQVNLAPTDFPHAQHILPHQLRQVGPGAQEILLVLDLHRSQGARFSEAWVERRPLMERLLSGLQAQDPRVRVREVDYAASTRRAIAERFFAGQPVPEKDARGGPYYSYLFGLHAAAHRHVLHLDADMLLGGASATWLAEAARHLEAREEVLCCSPLGGPPRADGQLLVPERWAQPDPLIPRAFLFRRFSTRVFFVDLEKLLSRAGPVRRRLAPPVHVLRALRAGNPPFREPENHFTRAMERGPWRRLEFLGEGAGLWSLHPEFRSPTFYARLPSLVREVEAGTLPEAQQGRENVHDSVVDWSDVRAARRQRSLWKRLGG